MKKQILILIFAFIGATTMHTAQAQTDGYDPLAVKRINDLIANNGLQATPNAPETWKFATWNDETPKQIVELELSITNIGNSMYGDASFAGLTTLQALYLFYSQLTKIDVTNCTQLQTLNCSYNRITEIDLTTCKQLKMLSYNNMPSAPSLDVTNCTQLEYLYCYSSKLTKLDISKCTQLQVLWCSENQIIELDLRGLNKLTEFIGTYQSPPPLTLYKNEEEEYALAILLNNPTFTDFWGVPYSSISYSEGILKSMDNTVAYPKFIVQTNKDGFELSGTMAFIYSDVGTDTIDEDYLKIYPNPNTGELTIENGNLKIKNIGIYDVNGRKQKATSRKQQAGGTTVIDISHLPHGIYFVKIDTETGEVVRKIVKSSNQ